MEHIINYKRIGYLRKKDKERKEALSAQDGAKYYNLCNELGMEPEDEYLYERGYLETKLEGGKK